MWNFYLFFLPHSESFQNWASSALGIAYLRREICALKKHHRKYGKREKAKVLLIVRSISIQSDLMLVMVMVCVGVLVYLLLKEMSVL